MGSRNIQQSYAEDLASPIPSVTFFPIDEGTAYEVKPWRKALAIANTIIALTILLGILVLLLHRLFVKEGD